MLTIIKKIKFIFVLMLCVSLAINSSAQERVFEGYKGHKDKSFTVYSQKFAEQHGLSLDYVDETLHPKVHLIDFQFARRKDTKSYDRSNLPDIKEIMIPDYKCSFHILVDDSYIAGGQNKVKVPDFYDFVKYIHPLIVLPYPDLKSSPRVTERRLGFSTTTRSKIETGRGASGTSSGFRMKSYKPYMDLLYFPEPCSTSVQWSRTQGGWAYENTGGVIFIPQSILNKVEEWAGNLDKSQEAEKRREERREERLKNMTFVEKIKHYFQEFLWVITVWFITFINSIQT